MTDLTNDQINDRLLELLPPTGEAWLKTKIIIHGYTDPAVVLKLLELFKMDVLWDLNTEKVEIFALYEDEERNAYRGLSEAKATSLPHAVALAAIRCLEQSQ